jgi:hypothetical protein
MGNPSVNSSRIEYPPAVPLPSAAKQRELRLATGHIVIVCGARDDQDRDRVFAALDRAHAYLALTLLVHRVSLDPTTWKLLGVDRWSVEWAFANGVNVEPRPVDRLTWGAAAESMRDEQMIEAGAHGLVALPGASDQLCKLAERFKIPVWRPFG